MRRIILFAALLGLTACGGEVLPEEQAPTALEQATPAPGEGTGEVSAQGPAWCSEPICCAQYRDANACVYSSGGKCFWSSDRRCVIY